MMFWILIAVLTAIASLCVLVPFSKASEQRTALGGAAADVAVYRQQLSEIDKELERGLVAPEAGEAARVEIARRLLAASDAMQTDTVTARKGRGTFLAVAIVCGGMLPAAALAGYFYVGSPDLPDQPFQARLAASPEKQSVELLVARIEQHLSENPGDGKGWAVVAPVYMRMGNPQAAATAYGNTIRLLGATAKRLSDFGEALTVANEGVVNADARAAFEQALKLEKKAVKPRFFLALSLDQEGRKDEAIAAWKDLLKGANPQQSWVPAAQENLARLTGVPLQPLQQLQSGSEPKTLGGPTEEDVKAAGNMKAEDRTRMIRGMVEGLAARLQGEGGSAEEWQRLIRAHMVLGEKQKAEEAVRQALENLASDAPGRQGIIDFARQAGLEGG